MGMDSKDPQVMWGPITLAMSFPFVAYVLRLPGAPVICLTAHMDEHRVLLDQSRRLLEITLTDAKQRYEKWQQIACLHTHVEPGGQQVRMDVYQGNETEPERIAEANLRGLTYSFVRTLDGTPCEVTQYAPEAGEIRCRYEFCLQDHPDRTGFIYAADEPDRLDRAIRALILGAEASKSFELGMYVEEASRLTGPLGAFHSFHHALRLATADDYPALIDVGLGLGSRLLAASSWDYADWVGAVVARLSDACERPMERVKALRIQGIASSRLGAISATVEYFETALDLLPRFDDALLKAQVRMSFGLSLMDLLAHWETLAVEERRASQARMHQRLEVADRELRAARKLFAESDDDRARRNTPFIDLELLRIRDLRGDHAGALSAFDAVARDVPTHDKQTLTAADIDQVKYEGTRLHYRLAAAIKVAELDAADSSGLLIEEIFRTVKQVNQLPTQRPIADRLCCLMVLAGQYFLQLVFDWRCAEARASGTWDGQSRNDESVPSLAGEDRDWIVAKLGEIKKNLSAAWKIQRSFGQEATLQRGLEDLRNCGVHHFLAHGVDAGSDNAMSSGLLLASESGGLPSRSYTASGNPAMSSAPVLASDRGSRSSSDDAAPMRARMLTAALMMANGTTASHVTLQACSVGRPSAAFRDELWGVTRALLAGGTSTVLAPLWDLDLRSSSQLLRRFYEQWLLHGQSAWLALASSQREMATGSTEEFRHFSHWGALQLAGC